MEELNIRHLKHYLGTGLLIFEGEQGEENLIRKMNLGKGRSNSWIGIDTVLKSHKPNFYSFYRPLLIPLSKITEEIEHNGEKVDVLKELQMFEENISGSKFIDWRNGKEIPFYQLEYQRIEILSNYHIDFQDLIGKGLAIDKTTI